MITTLKRRKREPVGLREPTVIRSPGHLSWVRGHECLISRIAGGCSIRIEAAHVRLGTDGGTSMKPGDNWVNPLCSDHHAEQHRIGEQSFARKYRIDLKAFAQALWQASPHRRKWEQKQGIRS